MKRIAFFLTVLVIGVLLLTSCGGIPKEVQDELTQLQAKEEQWKVWELELNQLHAEKKQWDKVLMPELTILRQENPVLKAQLAQIPKDSTFDELTKFIKEDKTDEIPNPFGLHLAWSIMFLENAAKKEIKGHLVVVMMQETPASLWYFTGFQTVDRGFVYVYVGDRLPGGTQIVKLKEGNPASDVNPAVTIKKIFIVP